MIVETSYIAAFLVGLLGGVHCVGMCGGIMGALTLGIKPINSSSSNPQGGWGGSQIGVITRVLAS